MKKKIIIASCIVFALITFVLVASAFVFYYYHPTHYSFNDKFVIGNTPENIETKYGEFYRADKNKNGEISYATYMIYDDTPDFFMGYDDSLWYDIYFENGTAIEVELREGYPAG